MKDVFLSFKILFYVTATNVYETSRLKKTANMKKKQKTIKTF